MFKRQPRSLGKRMRYQAEYLLGLLLSFLVPWLPRRGVVWLARCLGAISYGLVATSRRIAVANLDVAFGQTRSLGEKRKIARRAFTNLSLVALDFFWSSRVNAGNWQQYIDVSETDLAFGREIMGRGKGAIAVTLHFGNWEWMGMAAGYQGWPLSVIAEEFQNEDLGNLLNRYRRASGNELIDQHGAATKCIRALRNKRVLTAVMDTNVNLREGGIWVNYFGLPVMASSIVAALSLRTGAPIVPALCFPLGDGRYRLRYGPEINILPTGDEAADRVTLTQAIMDFSEKTVREYPELWLWMYKRWGACPTLEMKGYPFYARTRKVSQ